MSKLLFCIAYGLALLWSSYIILWVNIRKAALNVVHNDAAGNDNITFNIQLSTSSINRTSLHRRLEIVRSNQSITNQSNQLEDTEQDQCLFDLLCPHLLCPKISPFLIGRSNMDIVQLAQAVDMQTLSDSMPDIQPGGHWKPILCRPRTKIMVVVPFRNREPHLKGLLAYLMPMLQRQLLEFTFLVVEQDGDELFNKGRLHNAAFEVAETLGDYDVILFHDVDMVPEDDRNLYSCPESPRHLAPYTNTLNYELFYNELVGGALCFRREQYRQVNGYSDVFWGWGGEDDDMGYRILTNNMTISRPSSLIGRYTMFSHEKRSSSEGLEERFELLKSAKQRWRVEGLNKRLWRVLSVNKTALYYHIMVDVSKPPRHLRKQQR